MCTTKGSSSGAQTPSTSQFLSDKSGALICISLKTSDVDDLFMSVGYMYVFLRKMSMQTFFNRIFVIVIEFYEFFIIWMLAPY